MLQAATTATPVRPLVVSLRRGARRPPGRRIRKVDRSSPRWGNPYRTVDRSERARQRVIALYARRLIERVRNGDVTRDELAAFCGEVIACWCAPKSCHADVIADAAVAAAGPDDGWNEWLETGWRRHDVAWA